jgi:hypothetical protein
MVRARRQRYTLQQKNKMNLEEKIVRLELKKLEVQRSRDKTVDLLSRVTRELTVKCSELDRKHYKLCEEILQLQIKQITKKPQ